jgi:hypothetical protein
VRAGVLWSPGSPLSMSRRSARASRKSSDQKKEVMTMGAKKKVKKAVKKAVKKVKKAAKKK